MSAFLSSTPIQKIYIGSTEVQTAYIGGTAFYTSGAIDTTAFVVSGYGVENQYPAVATATFKIDGSATLLDDGTPLSPRWYSSTPPSIWMEYSISSSSGTSTVVGGLVSGTRYSMDTQRVLGITRSQPGSASKNFLISFYDAASGGNLLGQKGLYCGVSVEFTETEPTTGFIP